MRHFMVFDRHTRGQHSSLSVPLGPRKVRSPCARTMTTTTRDGVRAVLAHPTATNRKRELDLALGQVVRVPVPIPGLILVLYSKSTSTQMTR